MVAAPRTWAELASDDLAQLSLSEVLNRVSSHGDLLWPLIGEDSNAQADRLEAYRERRNPKRTPEPVPESIHPQTKTDSNSLRYVIQEHHASHLHWGGFRLEHDGVLASWALPRGMPESSKRNHLTVQTEDHPFEYGSFEGVIPPGEYGAGTVSIWDAGTYVLHKWRPGQEIIVTLESERRRARRAFALIHTGTQGTKNQWLIHLMDHEPAYRANSVPPQSTKPAGAAHAPMAFSAENPRRIARIFCKGIVG